MRIREVTLRELRMKLIAPFETSSERTEERRIILAEVLVDGVIGWGECVAGERPFYSPETTDTAWMVMREFLWPMIKHKEIGTAAEAWSMMGHVRGHNMAKAALEAAIWDAEAKQKDMPLARLLGGTREEISSGVSIGIKESLDELAAAVRKELAAGYQRVKIKIKPGKELPQVKRLREEFPGIKLMVDANSAYRMEDWPLLRELENFYLMMIEQPLGWDDLYAHVELQKSWRRRFAWTSAFIRRSKRGRRFCWGRARSSISSWGGWADSRWRSGYTICASKMVCRCGAGECWSPGSGGRTTLRFRRCRTSHCRGTSRPARGIGRRILSSRK
jgi:o-succinylbenzoate synthase